MRPRRVKFIAKHFACHRTREADKRSAQVLHFGPTRATHCDGVTLDVVRPGDLDPVHRAAPVDVERAFEVRLKTLQQQMQNFVKLESKPGLFRADILWIPAAKAKIKVKVTWRLSARTVTFLS